MALFRKKPAKPAKPELLVPALSPIVGMIVADVALRAGQGLLRRAIERGLLKGQPQAHLQAEGDRVIRGRTLGQTVVGTVLAEVARRSTPGAIVVGGGLIVKSLRDRAKRKRDKT